MIFFDVVGVERTFFVITKLVPIPRVSNATVQIWMGDRTNGHCGQNGQNEANISAKRNLISTYPDDGDGSKSQARSTYLSGSMIDV